MFFLGKLKSGLSKTRDNLLDKVKGLVGINPQLDRAFLEELEGILLSADIGVVGTNRIISGIQEESKKKNIKGSDKIFELLRNRINSLLENSYKNRNLSDLSTKPWVQMIVGVNGTGKTTTIGKLAKRYLGDNRKVLIAACDTFRAAAGEQLEIWANRVGVDMIRSQPGQDPASVAFDAVQAALSRGTDVLIADTAGRLHTKSNLMEELKKVKRVMGKCLPGAPQEILLVVDATTGQNALSQAKIFDDALGLSGLVLTKLDGTAKGGIVVAIASELKIPVKWIGVGEDVSDLEKFDSKSFVEALLE
ncbi:MAG: signal recognition particle-docking protein FtsY [candidate division Zixibacteria bacterium SM23_73_2]|nr:MAG: signal recognition particle-docking protein FtsY [candidate division Zixibacteria bacterium SM23_73_2]